MMAVLTAVVVAVDMVLASAGVRHPGHTMCVT